MKPTTAGLAGLLVAVAFASACRVNNESRGDLPVGDADGSVSAGQPVTLYFPAPDGRLAAETHNAPEQLDAEALRVWIAGEIATGPQTEELLRAVPEGSEVISVFSAPGGTVYVDLGIPGDTPAMGSADELLAIYSIVNSLSLHDDSLDRVVLLVNGRQRETFAGHIDTSRPLGARADLIGDPN